MTREEFDIAKSQAKFIPNPEYNEDEDDEKDEFICIEFLGFKVGDRVLISKEVLIYLGFGGEWVKHEVRIEKIDCSVTEIERGRELFFLIKNIEIDEEIWVKECQMRHTKLYKSTNSDEAKSEIKILVEKVKSDRRSL